MGKKSPKKGYYYCNTDKMYKPIPKGYKVRDDGILVKEGWSSKYKKSIDCNNPKGFSQKAHCQGKRKRMTEESNPRIPRKKGQPAKSKKHSDLYTDEDPKGTIHGLGFKDVATAKASVAKIRKSSRKHAHKIQAAIAMEQRARVMGKTSEAAIFRKFINSMKKKTKAMNEEKKGDHEYEMIRRQTDNIMVAAKKLKQKVGKGEGDVKAWVQSKITKAADYLDTAADYMTDKEEVKEGSLHKWFKGSKSKDGKGGWVNVVTGGTCASDEPGEGTPKCVSSAKRASMSKKERLSAARRKKKADPNQQSKSGAAKPTYVSTDKKSKKKKKMKEEFISLPLQLEVPQNDGEFKLGMMFRESLEQDRGMLFIFENTDYHSFHMKNTFIPLDIAFINEEGIIESIKELDPMNPIPVYPDGEIRYAIEVNRGWFAENGVVVGDAILEEGCQKCGDSCDNCECECHNHISEAKDRKGKGSGKKDACYHKVKSRYSVWPSAYASGALVKCRKVGAANWGNSRKEEVEYETKVYKTPHYRWRDEIVEHHRKDEDGNTIPHEHEDELTEKLDNKDKPAVNKVVKGLEKATKLHTQQAKSLAKAVKEHSDWRQELEEKKGQKCWPGYEKKGTKMMFGKRYNNCVKKTKKEELEVETPSLNEKVAQEFAHTAGLVKRSDKTVTYKPYTYGALQRFYATSTGAGSIYEKKMTKKQMKKRDEIADAIGKKDMKKRYGDENVRYAIATKLAMKEDITDEALTIQNWNVDDIKYTEIETVDVIKAKPLKENAIKTAKMTAKLFRALNKQKISNVKNIFGRTVGKPGAVKFSRTFKPIDVGTASPLPIKDAPSIIHNQKQLNTLIQGAKERVRQGKGIPSPLKTKFRDTKKGTELFADKRGINTIPPSPTGAALKKLRLSPAAKKVRAFDKQMDRYTYGTYKPVMGASFGASAYQGVTGKDPILQIGDIIKEPGRKRERERRNKELDKLYNKMEKEKKEKKVKKEEFSQPLKENKVKLAKLAAKNAAKIAKQTGLFSNLSKKSAVKVLNKPVGTPGTTYAQKGSKKAFDAASAFAGRFGTPQKPPFRTLHSSGTTKYGPSIGGTRMNNYAGGSGGGASIDTLGRYAFKGGGSSKGRIDPYTGDRISFKQYRDLTVDKPYTLIKGAKFGDKIMATKGKRPPLSPPFKQEKLPYPKPRTSDVKKSKFKVRDDATFGDQVMVRKNEPFSRNITNRTPMPKPLGKAKYEVGKKGVDEFRGGDDLSSIGFRNFDSTTFTTKPDGKIVTRAVPKRPASMPKDQDRFYKKNYYKDSTSKKDMPTPDPMANKFLFGKPELKTGVKKKGKTIYKDHYDWRSQLDDDVLYRLDRLEEDWQKVNRKDKTDGLSKKAVKAYRRENPGSKLKTAVTKDPKKLKKGSKDAKRRLSFCRRMKGMKKRLTSAKTARDPDSRINKALRRWNC